MDQFHAGIFFQTAGGVIGDCGVHWDRFRDLPCLPGGETGPFKGLALRLMYEMDFFKRAMALSADLSPRKLVLCGSGFQPR
jgi:hypothetical protein